MQNPTPQLKVFNISFSLIFCFFNHLKTLLTFILLKSISAHNPLGIILLILSAIPPPVMLAQPLTRFFLLKLRISLT